VGRSPASAGPGSSRMNVVPRRGSSTRRPAGSGGAVTAHSPRTHRARTERANYVPIWTISTAIFEPFGSS
jgi:hypothetical protein